MTLAAIGSAIWDAIKKVPGWLWLVVAGVLVGWNHMENEKARVRKEVNDQRDKEAAEVEREIVSNITENSDEVVREADAVRSHTSASVLPNKTGATLSDPHYRD
jgi:hypothetical protein